MKPSGWPGSPLGLVMTFSEGFSEGKRGFLSALQGPVALLLFPPMEETAVRLRSPQLLVQLKVSHSAQAVSAGSHVTHLTISVHSRGLWSPYHIQA